MLIEVARQVSVVGLLETALLCGFVGTGCAGQQRTISTAPTTARYVLLVTPVLNLSGTSDLDALKLTDALASELTVFENFSVVPVNLALAALAGRGQTVVETPEDALALAREFNADATIVAAVTEFDPYDPPVVGLVMQWYVPPERDPAGGRPGAGGVPSTADTGPRYQVQRVFNAADKNVLDELRVFAAQRAGVGGPLGWRRFAKSQELYVRYCWSTLIRPIAARYASPGSDRLPAALSCGPAATRTKRGS